MYGKISPPSHSVNANGGHPMSGRDTGLSSTTHRTRTDIARSNPVTPTHLETGGSNSDPTSPAHSSTLSSLFNLKKGRLLYSSDSPKKRKSRNGCLSFLTESRYSQHLYAASLAANVLLVLLILLSYSSIGPFCSSDTPHRPTLHHHIHDVDANHNANNAALDAEPPNPAVEVTAPVVVPSPPPADDKDWFESDFSDVGYVGPETHAVQWRHCLQPVSHLLTLTDEEKVNITSLHSFPVLSCPTTPTVEQSWQIGWYGGQVAVNGGADRHLPNPQQCVHLPPTDYQWPPKYTDLPATSQDFFHWPNLRVSKFEDLLVFNEATPKNLYHFNAPKYDLDGLEELALAAEFIPFETKIRNFLDIGAGGGSLGLVLKRKFGVETMSIIFPDWPYCEYITERGGLCVLVDVMEAMPFAHWSFDVVHISWVYHGQQPHELLQMYTEIDRIVRPGGYVWQRGGWSIRQVDAMKALFAALGYVQVHEKLVMKTKNDITFGPDLPFEAEWWCIYVKPIRAQRKDDCTTAPQIQGPQR